MEDFFSQDKKIEIGKYYGHQYISLQEALRLFLECSRKHTLLQKGIDENNYTWILYKWVIKALDYPIIGQEVKVETKLRQIDSLYAYRQFYIKDKDDNLLIDGKSQFVILDPKTRRIKRIPKIYHRQAQDNIKAYFQMDKIPCQRPGLVYPLFRHDMDENQHLNNISYIDYVLESIYSKWPQLLTERKISDLHIVYSREVVYPSNIEIVTDRKEDQYVFEVLQEEGQIVLASGMIMFN